MMSEIVIITALASVVGMVWGYRKPAGYCRMSTAEQQGMSNRLWSGLINAVVVGGLVFIVTAILLG
jgi:hypothetical protein